MKKKETLKKIFTNKSNRQAILNALYYQIMGALICLTVLFCLTGGKNYIKLYKELNKVIDTYDTITKNNYGKVDKKDLTEVAINAMLDSIKDKYTNYSDEEEATTFLESVEGHYEGLGISVKTDYDGNIVVVNVFDGSPAKEAGIKEEDIIIKVDDVDLKEKNKR